MKLSPSGNYYLEIRMLIFSAGGQKMIMVGPRGKQFIHPGKLKWINEQKMNG